ncbi:sulfite oxidase heme-binding subunit YedZ [Leeia aquatica]|uniref:Protein-methionine-sulfoxide reductase heme-binding subunit MsrQ n=1 Tax=Leeia aquatica TaxID=2725557 RepID=A0A847SLD6_9NEIS|nr:protein-methionine-sulfoxide reductase heme-binding subunit MsrQ [Leeia aquatica]NLR76752.1 sulfoxide reductase heme-binding subunit YedZ [Leeia aquatica]
MLSYWRKLHWTVRLKCLLWPLLLLPLARLAVAAWHDIHHGSLWLSANPIEFILRSTGTWALTFLLCTLAVTPLRQLLQRPELLRIRRLLGLFAFFYACLHLGTYLWLDQGWDWMGMLKDVWKRPFITVGMTAWLLLLPLAATSTRWAMRKLGRRWQSLHRLAYLAPALGVLHYWWLVKADYRTPLLFGLSLLLLLGWRVWRKQQASAAPAQVARQR